MKQGVVFVLACSALLAAVAVAHVVAPLPDRGRFQATAKADTASAASFSTSKPVVGAPASKPLVEFRQAPVPLHLRERPVVIVPATDEATATTPPLTPPSDAEGDGFARGAIEADGYRSVKNIAAGPDGTWRARALRGKTEVVLTVDREGRVSAD